MWCRSLLCAACLILTTTAAMAQPAAIQRGSIMISGTASVTRQEGDMYGGDEYTTITLMPRFGYFTTDGTFLGAFVSYSRLSASEYAQYLLGFGPTVAYFVNTDSDAVPFIGAGVKLLRVGMTEGRSSDSETGYGFFLSGGVVILAGSHLGITVEASFDHDRYSVAGSTMVVTGNTFGLAVGLAGFLN